jgi:glycosyltransferase involved in cell wall biosynthesis
MGESCALLNPIQWDEPFGLVMIEALATGSPVVATPRGSVQEIVEEGRTGFVRGTPRDLAAALQRVGELDRAACRGSAETRFSAERMAADYVALFEDLVRRPHPIDRAGAARPAAVTIEGSSPAD